MITENLSTLKIHKLTQEQYDREFAAGRIDPNALYLTPDENNADNILDIKHGGTGVNSIVDTVYEKPRYRASSLHSSETKPSNNGTICWVYE